LADDARVILNADGTIADANEAAQLLYGASLAELRAAPPGAFSANPEPPEAQAAFRRIWESEGQPDLVGQATLHRPDGSSRRVGFGISRLFDGRYAAFLHPLDEPTEEVAQVFTAGEVLARWRAAERELETIAPDSPEASTIQVEIERFRQAYQQAFGASPGGTRPEPG
jgi:PAS domain-containing protein